MEKLTNIKELRDSLIEMYTALKQGEIGVNEAKTQANVAGKIVSSAKTQLEYNKYANSKRKINFLEVDE
jgi:hypothetical protein